jgi:predicted RNase H-like nuclease
MLGGAEVFAALEPAYPLYAGSPPAGPVCFETFPQAVACALAGKIVSAKEKRPVRTALLAQAGIEVDRLSSIDEVDATLCALAARRFVEGSFRAYGDTAGGYLIA